MSVYKFIRMLGFIYLLPVLGFAQSVTDLNNAVGVVSAYESSRSPLWLNDATRNNDIPREPAGGLELERAIIAVMQGLLDHAYVPEKFSRFRETLDGAMDETSGYFPGAVDPTADPSVSHEVKSNASRSAAWANFESEKFMMPVPASWKYAFDSPDIIIQNWDKAADLVSDLLGKSRLRNRKIVLYMQIDNIIRGVMPIIPIILCQMTLMIL